MLCSKTNIFVAIAIFCCSSFAYSASPHLFQVDIDDNLKKNAIVAFNYNTASDQGPGAVVFRRHQGGTSSQLFGMEVYGELISITEAVVQYDFEEYRKYKLHQSCRHIPLRPSRESRGVMVTLHVDRDSQSISCSTQSIG